MSIPGLRLDRTAWRRALGWIALAAMLLGLDVWRAYSSRVAPWLWVAGALSVALVGRLALRRSPHALALIALLALLVPAYANHTRTLSSDGLFYYSYLRSVVFDRDLQFGNDYALLGVTYSTDRNVFPIGPALLWSPFVLPVHLVAEAARAFGGPTPTGTERAYHAAASLATLAYGAAGILLLYRLLLEWVPARAAFVATLLCWWGSPLNAYITTFPYMSHGMEFLSIVLVIKAYLRLRARMDAGSAALAGALCGLAFLVRYQSGLALMLAAMPLLPGLVRGATRGRNLRLLAAMLAAFALVALPQALEWHRQFGRFALVPQTTVYGGGFIKAASPRLWETLVAPQGGLFSYYPVLLLGVLGLAWMLGWDAAYVLAAVPLVLAQWYVNASVFDWEHVRRFTGIVPLLAPGMAIVLARATRSRLGLAVGLLLALACARYDEALAGLRAPLGGVVAVRDVLAGAADELARDSYDLLESIAPRTAARLWTSYTGKELLGEATTYLELSGDDDPLLRLDRHVRHRLTDAAVEDGLACRWARGLYVQFELATAWTGPALVVVKAHPLDSSDPPAMQLLWNGTACGAQRLAPGWAEYRYVVPDGVVAPGTNVLAIQFDRGALHRRVRGEGPRETQAAALAEIRFHRYEDALSR